MKSESTVVTHFHDTEVGALARRVWPHYRPAGIEESLSGHVAPRRTLSHRRPWKSTGSDPASPNQKERVEVRGVMNPRGEQ